MDLLETALQKHRDDEGMEPGGTVQPGEHNAQGDLINVYKMPDGKV